MNWQAVAIGVGALCSLGGLTMGALSLRLAVKRHRAQAGSEEVDYDTKRQQYEEEAAMRRSRFYATSLSDADEELQRMRKRHEDFKRETERRIDELQKAIEAEREARKQENCECDRKLAERDERMAAARAERDEQIATLNAQIAVLHQRIGSLTTGQL